MGLLIVLLVCAVIIKIETDKKKVKAMDIGIVISAVITGLVSFVYLMSCSGRDSLHFKYNDEERKEVIQLEELQPNVFVNYSYSNKEYSYKVSVGAQNDEMRAIDSENAIIQERIDPKEEPRIERYKMKNPKSFWVRYIPWISTDKYVIYMPEKEMISRTP